MTTETMAGWRESTDPAELAAAVAELGRWRVQIERPIGGWETTGTRTADQFAFGMGTGCRYRVPADWQWEPCEACRERLAAVPDVPDGHELVVLPSEVVDGYAEALYVDERLSDACLAARARRPKPEPRTERVPWWEAVGRRLPDGTLIDRVHADGRGAFAHKKGSGFLGKWADTDGTVEVLAEGVES